MLSLLITDQQAVFFNAGINFAVTSSFATRFTNEKVTQSKTHNTVIFRDGCWLYFGHRPKRF